MDNRDNTTEQVDQNSFIDIENGRMMSPNEQVAQPTESNQEEENSMLALDRKYQAQKSAIIAIMFSLPPILLWGYSINAVLNSNGNFTDSSPVGGAFWVLGAYYLMGGIGVVISVFSFIFISRSLKNKKNNPLAIISIILKAITVIEVIVFFVIIALGIHS